MVPYTVRPDLVALWDIALGVALLTIAANQRASVRRWLFGLLAGVLIWIGVFASIPN